jgi:hypothetical protein
MPLEEKEVSRAYLVGGIKLVSNVVSFMTVSGAGFVLSMKSNVSRDKSGELSAGACEQVANGRCPIFFDVVLLERTAATTRRLETKESEARRTSDSSMLYELKHEKHGGFHLCTG